MTAVNNEDRTDRWHARLTQIIDTAASLYARNGYAATGMSELGEAVDLGRGALYYYIESKENLLSLIHDRVIDEVLESARDVQDLDVGPLEKLRLLGSELIRIITTYPDHVWVFLHEYRALTGERGRRFREQRREYEKAITDVLREGQESGVFDIKDVDLAMLAWLGMHNYTYIWYRSSGRVSPVKVATWFHEYFVHGIVAHGVRTDGG